MAGTDRWLPIIYEIHDNVLTIVVVSVGNRRDTYKNAEDPGPGPHRPHTATSCQLVLNNSGPRSTRPSRTSIVGSFSWTGEGL